ncbi:MetQ/NlpA family ABC transporter substrate-binding protein [Leptotrichia sp. oral taxon 218]|jgi:NLPA lipoprotein|uniref:MetQ/NlpA family ABC transporter substrate-binding protein n=1 Tax=Leptotrichia sp. oral taxon 218 TaxID=712361 RepID=UPI001B8B45B1|nr:MetQ/NlpA family ABC transporter substrate-binding protein [Leptotrichia sp. oral taxon 218]QUB95981.1 MetQ/NlpA family ABC transporter substrate-binding protein [Leptotrichia sp. oral taxon 218]
MKKILALLVALALFVVSCGKGEKLKVGATPVPHGEFLKLVKDDLKKQGVDLEIVQFNDYILPNKALADKSIDANFFQHVPYMEDFAKRNNIPLVSVGNVHLEPMALYSKKIKNIKDLKPNDTLIIPNDPTNGGRALILLDKAGIIKLKDNKKLDSTTKDIASNPKKIKIVTLSNEQIAPRLVEVAGAIINSNFAINAGVTKNEIILQEDKNSPYANVVTVLKGNENDPRIQKLMKALQSEKVKKYIEEKYEGRIIPAF